MPASGIFVPAEGAVRPQCEPFKTHLMKKHIVTGTIAALLCATPAFTLNAQSMILTSDRQLRDMAANPDKPIDTSIGHTPRIYSLRELCETKRRNGSTELNVFFDEFFKQYRPGERDSERELTPDIDEYIDLIRQVSDFAEPYGIGLGLSLLSPLELGRAYKNQTGGSGRWVAYKVGMRSPEDGTLSLQMWQHLAWVNNKGRMPVTLRGVKAYAFRERKLGASPYRAVDPEDIVPLDGVEYEVTLSSNRSIPMNSIRVFGSSDEHKGYDKVLVILEYETQEMDYFADDAPGFLRGLVDKYHDRGVNLVSLYSDEMHIQQDWHYTDHHENGQFNHRYLTDNFARQFGERYGTPLDDRYMLYFVYGAQNYEAGAFSVVNEQYVMGDTPEDIHRTFLLRDRYYRMLNDHVVDLFLEAKNYAEGLYGRRLPTDAHASWAQSPTIDFWNYEKRNGYRQNYEYTSAFLWGNTVHQAAVACYDYFKWSEYLEPTGNDFAEGGWNDRNYYGAAMAASIGVINACEKAYAEAWGMPAESKERRTAINRAYGAELRARNDIITHDVHRDTEVLILYPMNLVAVEERFGSWMTQYGYGNYLTSDKLLAMGEVLPGGGLRVAKKTYGTLVVMFEPLPEAGLLDVLEEFVAGGGRLVWCGPPPLLDKAGNRCSGQWERLMGASHHYDAFMGEMAPGRFIEFTGSFSAVPPQIILTDLLPDRLYPVTPAPGAETVALSEGRVVGTVKRYAGGGLAAYCGFRPRDDQSRSLGYEVRTLFEILDAVGAYPPTGTFPGVNDNPSYLSRTTDYFVSSFPNGSTIIVRHYRTHPETWEYGFSRNPEADSLALVHNPMPDGTISLRNFMVNGHTVCYEGDISVGFRIGADGRLAAFDGRGSREITVDGIRYLFSGEPCTLRFGSYDDPSVYRLWTDHGGELRIPLPSGARSAALRGTGVSRDTQSGGSEGGVAVPIPVQVRDGYAVFTLPAEWTGKWTEMVWE